MHICFPSLSYPLNDEPTSGVGAQVRVLARALTEAGHEVSVIDLGSQPSIASDSGVIVNRICISNLHWFLGKLPLVGKILALPVRELEYSLGTWKSVRAINRSRPIDVIEGTETGMLLLALLSGPSVIIRLHGEQYTFQKFTPGTKLTLGLRVTRALQRVALRRARLLISPSYAHAREIQRELHRSHPPIVVVPNNISVNGVSQNGAHRDARSVVYAGRIDKPKGIMTLLRAAAQTKQTIPDARFVIAGQFQSSVPETEFRELVKSSNLEENVTLLGSLGREALADLYSHSTVAVLPSHYETFGLAALEPMSFGTPVIASDTGGLPEIVIPNVNGTLVPPGDETALAGAIIELLRDSDTRKRLGDGARKYAANYDVRHVTTVTERLYLSSIDDTATESEYHVFFSPHADDVVLSCGGTVDSLVERNRHVQVITVFSPANDATPSAFAQHIHRKWGTNNSSAQQRALEDASALRVLGISDATNWKYPEAPDRRAADGTILYASYVELSGSLSAQDEVLVDELFERASALDIPADAWLYFPLSLGRHVDHQVLFKVGYKLLKAGKLVRFYEDYPYAESYEPRTEKLNWLPHSVPVSLDRKLAAVAAYESQLTGLGGSISVATRRIQRFATRFSESAVERYWEFVPTPPCVNGSVALPAPPLDSSTERLRLRDFKRFIETFRWHDLDEMLPAGTGNCANVGAGSGRHKEVIEARGFKSVSIDNRESAEIRGDAATMPLASSSQAAVVAWQVLEYVDEPAKVFAEAARVLQPGGLLCGSVSFLEPVHGHTYFGLSPLIVEKLLRQNGFSDITIKAGLNGFALMLWTWLRRTSIPRLELFALPIAFLLIVPFAAALFMFSWLLCRLGFGSGHLMRWISRTAPLEFAGHVLFCARKRARF